MFDKIKLNSKEINMIMVNVLSVKLLFTFPKKLIVLAGNAAWIQIIYMSLLMFGVFLIISLAYRKCPNKSIIELSEDIGGKYLKIFIGVSVSIALFLNLASTIRSFPELVKMVLLPDTPLELILIIFALTVSVGAYLGIESIAIIHSIIIPLVLGLLALFFVFLLPNMDYINIMPVLGKGTYNIFVKGLSGIDFFDDIIILNLLIPYMDSPADFKKNGIKSIAVSSLLVFLIVLAYVLIYPYPSSEKFIIPVYQLARLVGIGDFFQRFEAFFEFIWSLSIFLYSSIYIIMMCNVWKKTFNLKYEKPLIFPMTALVTMLSFSAEKMYEIIFNYWYITLFMLMVAFVLPIIIPIIYKKKKRIS